MRALRMTALVGLMTLVGGALVPGIADAQDSNATITVEQIHSTPTGAHYVILVSGADGGATVTATPTSPDGEAGDPVTLTAVDDSGRYQGGVEMPDDGTWTVTFASTDPDATLEHEQKVPAEDFTAEGSSAEDDEPSPVVPLIFAGLFVLALAGMGAWALIERRKPTPEATADGDDGDPGGDVDPGGGGEAESSVSSTADPAD